MGNSSSVSRVEDNINVSFSDFKDSNISTSYMTNLRQLCVDATNLSRFLRREDILNIASSCHELFATLLPFIEANFYFNTFPGTEYSTYHPKRLTVYTPNAWININSHITHIKFSNTFNCSIEKLPATLTHLKFGMEFNQHIDNFLPAPLTDIEFGENFNQPFTVFPALLKFISFPENAKFNQPLNIPPSVTRLASNKLYPNLPSTVEQLILYSCTQESLECLPPTTIEINFSASFNLPLSNIPPNLTSVSFGEYFNQSIDSLPSTVRTIHFSYFGSFNQPMNKLPSSLNGLFLSGKFDQQVDNLPLSLKYLRFGSNFNHPLNHLPSYLLALEFEQFSSKFHQSITFPPYLSSLVIPFECMPNQLLLLPQSLISLKIHPNASCIVTTLPTYLETLHASGNHLQQLAAFPKSLQSLCVSPPYIGPFNSLPRHCAVTVDNYLDTLDIPSQFKLQALHLNIGAKIATSSYSLEYFSTVTSIRFPTSYNNSIPPLPNSLRVLVMGSSFNQILPILPPSLQELQLGGLFNQPIVQLPASLLILHLGANFNHPIDYWPPLRQLVLRNPNYYHPLNNLPLTLIELHLNAPHDSLPHQLKSIASRHLFQHNRFYSWMVNFHIPNYFQYKYK